MTLFTSPIQEHLTASPTDRMARATHPGMAHFAGSGPTGETCRTCRHWNHGPYDYTARNGKSGGLIKPAPCAKYKAMTGNAGPKIPDDVAACKHHEKNESPPPRFKKG